MQQILITGANPYNDNKGVAALCYSLVYIINEILEKQKKTCRIAVYTHEFTETNDCLNYGEKRIDIHNIFPTQWKGLASLCKAFSSKWRLFNLKEFFQSSLVLSVNAGDSFADIYGDNIFNAINECNELSIFFKKPLVLLPQTYGPFNQGGKALSTAKKVIEKSELVLSRDEESANYVNLITGKTIEELIDLAFFLPFYDIKQSHDKINVGVNISSLLWHGGYTKNNQFGLSQSYEYTMKSIIGHLLKMENVRVHLIAHVQGDRYNVENDYTLAYDLWNKYRNDRLVIAPFFLNPVDAKSYISSMDLFMGSRMHACIGAFSSGVPVIPLAYSRKFSGLFTHTLQYPHNIDLTESGLQNITSHIDQVLNNLDTVRNQIERTNNTIVRERKNRLYAHIDGLIKKYIK